jgi:RHS repeat-associated protein
LVAHHLNRRFALGQRVVKRHLDLIEVEVHPAPRVVADVLGQPDQFGDDLRAVDSAVLVGQNRLFEALQKRPRPHDVLRLVDADYYDGGAPVSNQTPDTSYDYAYDLISNRTRADVTVDGLTTSQLWTYDAASRITNSGFSYDARGNLITDGAATYTYDSANRLTQWSAGGDTATFAYNGFGDRVAQTFNSQTTQYQLDLTAGLTQMVGEFAPGDETWYLLGLDLIAQDSSAAGSSYPLTDGLGSIRAVMGSGNSVLHATNYDPYGNPLAVGGLTQNAFGFTGQQTDDTDLQYLRARYYSPALGTFLTTDPVLGVTGGPVSTFNPYSYVRGNTVNLTDPSGRFALLLGAFAATFIADIAFNDAQGVANALGTCPVQLQKDIRQAAGEIGRVANKVIDDIIEAIAPYEDVIVEIAVTAIVASVMASSVGLVAAVAPAMAGKILIGGAVLNGIVSGMAGRAFSNMSAGRSWNHGLGDLGNIVQDGLFGLVGGFLDEFGDAARVGRRGRNVGSVCGVNSFSAETAVVTADGDVAISEIEVGDTVLAYNEATGETGEYLVTATIAHHDPTVVYLTISGETLTTTAEHPFYTTDGE